MATKKKVKSEKYLVVAPIASQDGQQHWVAGEEVELSDEVAAILLEVGSISKLNDEDAPGAHQGLPGTSEPSGNTDIHLGEFEAPEASEDNDG